MQTVSEHATGKLESRGNDKVKELRKRIDDSLDILAKSVDEVRVSETFRAFLTVQARFHKYSWCNSLLIPSQRPDATRVAGYRTWQSLVRQVCKGERGICIFAPCPWKRERENDKGETEIEQGLFFRAVHVFDVAQTDGPDLPSVDVPLVESDATELLAALERVAVKREIAVTYQKLDGSRLGYATDRGKAVVIDDT